MNRKRRIYVQPPLLVVLHPSLSRKLLRCHDLLRQSIHRRISEDFPPGFEGQNFKKGNFTQQLQEIDEELTKFDGMEGIDMNADSLPNQDSNTLLSPVSSENQASQIPILPVNGFSYFQTLESTSIKSPLRDISNSQGTHQQNTLLLGPKWTRVARIASGVSEILDIWLENRGCHDTVVEVWDRAVSGSPMAAVVSKLEACQHKLMQWSKNSFCNVSVELKEKRKLLQVAEREAAQGKNVEVFMQLKSEIRSFARDYIRDFQNLTCIPSCSVCTTPRRWCPPVDDVWKVNFNGAMFGEFDEAGIVVVIRDSRGEVKAALSEKIKKPPTVDVLELLAAKRAMTFSLETGTTRALVEGDSATVIKAIQLGGWELAQGGHLIHDISILKNSFQSISFSHVVWQGNAVAHALAHRARHSFPLSVLVEHVPQDIVSFFLHDLRFS
nr:hypothetical protein CFP56_43970 [Quercus suber]